MLTGGECATSMITKTDYSLLQHVCACFNATFECMSIIAAIIANMPKQQLQIICNLFGMLPLATRSPWQLLYHAWYA